jgi:hypothetical protein
MATLVSRTIGAGGYYATMADWIADCPPNLVTADQIYQGRLLNQAFTGSTCLCYINGITTDATRYVELTVDAGASFADNVSKVTRFDSSKGASISSNATSLEIAVIRNTVNFTRFSRLMVESTALVSGGAGVSTAIHIGPGIADKCIFEATHAEFNQGVVNLNGGQLSNSYVTCRVGGASGELISGNGSSNCRLTNVIAAVPSDLAPAAAGIRISYFSALCKNVTFLNVTALRVGTSGTVTDNGGNRTTVAGNPSGFTTVTFNNSLVVNSALSGRDFSPVSGSALYGATADTTYAPVDIFGVTRPTGAGTSYAGPQELVGGGGGSSALLPQFLQRAARQAVHRAANF